MNELWAMTVMVLAHAGMLVWAYRMGVRHGCDALVQRFEGEVEGLREASEYVKR